jgi:hypothetical protein
MSKKIDTRRAIFADKSEKFFIAFNIQKIADRYKAYTRQICEKKQMVGCKQQHQMRARAGVLLTQTQLSTQFTLVFISFSRNNKNVLSLYNRL